MKNLKTYILEASILGDIDDVLADGDKYAQKKEIVEWIKENDGFIQMFSNYKENDELYKNHNKLEINSKNQININIFRPLLYHYAGQQNTHLNLPIPEFIKINTVNEFDIVGNKGDLAKINFNKLPKIEKCNTMFLRCWDGRHNKWLPALSKLNIDEIGLITIDIEGAHPQEWPQNNVKTVYLFTNTITNYDRDYVEQLGYNYDLHKLSGLSADELIVPDCCITENISLILTQLAVKKDIVIDKENFPLEWKNINLIFDSKSFKKLYVYSAAVHSGYHKFKEIKKVGNNFVIKGRSTNVLNKYWK